MWSFEVLSGGIKSWQVQTLKCKQKQAEVWLRHLFLLFLIGTLIVFKGKLAAWKCINYLSENLDKFYLKGDGPLDLLKAIQVLVA